MHIATFASHSALQILKGAKDEGFKTILLCPKDRIKVYQSFNVADNIIEMSLSEPFDKVEPQLIAEKAILIPHGSFVQHLGVDRCMQLKALYYGNKNVLAWETDRTLQHQWLKHAELHIPKTFQSPKDIDRTVIVKFHGAAGGHGYFIANSEAEFNKKLEQSSQKHKNFVIQEYIIGVPVYIHYFYSQVTNELEIMGFDRRYETNVDGIGRIPAQDQLSLAQEPSYVVVGNIPIVIRESLLPKVFAMGERVVAASKIIDSRGLFGPFCIETILTPEQKFVAFEISARIVAGTNVAVDGSPYTSVKYGIPMSTGRRIARDISQAIKNGELHKVIG
ncbi:MAG TPA: formate--phosphoribosylaminoimidazolecarboxamide ligase [Candidatus Nanoarchaeia archaeon]|nr:formate--phosphoribosylaminoimidazolecarboxamide ligase [Candidatus Nanoarchaeia archaeon]